MSLTQLTTAANIQAYFQGISVFSETTRPTLAQVSRWIDQVTAIIYGALRSQYVTPITDPDDLKQLEGLADLWVLDNVRQVLGFNPVRQLDDGRLIPVQPSHKEFNSQLEDYMDGNRVLPNSISNASYSLVGSFNATNNICSVAKKETVQW